jgi:hypothetical protein
MDTSLLTTRMFWRQRQAEGWISVWALHPPEDEDVPEDDTLDPDWLALSQLEGMAYDWTERVSPGTMPFDELWTCHHQGVLFYPGWALERAWIMMVGTKQVLHPTLAPRR